MVSAGAGGLVKASLEQGRKAGDPLASIVKDIKVEQNKEILLLKDSNGEEVEVEIEIDKPPGLSAGKIYDQRTKLQAKEQKTKAAADIALKKAHQSAVSEIKAQKMAQRKKANAVNRKQMWFEKFYWFISSENYLVISARDAQQNEVIVKKYLSAKDLVFHAQIQGAAFTIVKNPKDTPIPFQTINEAALAALSHSRAWDLKVAVEVYYVTADQVSKSAPTGLYLPTGSFMIYGKKNFVSPARMEMGFGLLWRIDEESARRHAGERSVKTSEMILPSSDSNLQNTKTEAELIDTTLTVDKKSVQKQKQKETKEEEPKDDDEIAQKPKSTGKDKDKKKKGKGKEKEKEKDKGKSSKGKVPAPTEKQPEQHSEQKKLTIGEKRKLDKLKKIAEKFADETPEETELRMKILGSKKNYKVEKLKENTEFSKKQEPQKTAETPAPIAPSVETKPEPAPKENKIPNEKPKKKNQPKDEEADQENENEAEELNEEDYSQLTGNPLAEDVVYDAVPVCAPYSTLSGYKYKIKLQPGNLKKGKIFKSAVEVFLKQTEGSEKEKETVRALPDAVGVMQVVGNSKILTAGFLKIKQQMKKPSKK